MIDIATETLITLDDAAKRLVVSRCTVSRWVTNGSRGVKLEAIRVGGRWRTSVEALQRFAVAGTPGREPNAPPSSVPVGRAPASTRRQREEELVEQQLDERLRTKRCQACRAHIVDPKGLFAGEERVWCPKCLIGQKSATLGLRVRTFRRAASVTQQVLSDRTGIGVDLLRAYECDEKKPPDAHLAKLIDALGAELVSGMTEYSGGDWEGRSVRAAPCSGAVDQHQMRRDPVPRSQKSAVRRPATKFPHLRKKLQKSKVRAEAGKKKK